jgi:beta-glucosidase
MNKINGLQLKVGDYYIGILSGTDSVHGNQHVLGTPLFPHNIGLAASKNPKNIVNEAKWTAKSVLESGFNYAFAPTVAVSHNPQWGRFYETQGFDENIIATNAQAYVTNA